jgi:hypothetical protein
MFILCRVFMNRQIEWTYMLLFQHVFKHVETIIRQSIKWQHIHNVELHEMILNMNFEQMKNIKKMMLNYWQYVFNILFTNFVLYLIFIDFQNRHWKIHSQFVILFCQIHFKRDVIKTFDTIDSIKNYYNSFVTLLNCQIKRKYFDLLNFLKEL